MYWDPVTEETKSLFTLSLQFTPQASHGPLAALYNLTCVPQEHTNCDHTLGINPASYQSPLLSAIGGEHPPAAPAWGLEGTCPVPSRGPHQHPSHKVIKPNK